MAVLAGPQDHVVPADAEVAEGVGQPARPLVELGPGQADVAVDGGIGERVGAGVLTGDVGQGEAVELVHRSIVAGHGRTMSRLRTLPMALRGSSSTNQTERGTL